MSELDNLFQTSFKFNKKFGQNFIFDNNLLNAIVNDAGVDENTLVLEIGTGAGTLTRALAKKAKQVITFEIDRELEPYLTSVFEGYENIKINFLDIMKLNLENFEKELNGEKYVMVANLPYYITTPIIFKFLEEAKNLTAMYIMVQKEVADRICATAGSSDYGSITASIDVRGDARISRKVNRKMFTPAPNVDSAIVEIKLNNNKFEVFSPKLLERVITASFAMRRKTLANNLKSAFGLNSSQINDILTQMELKEGVRGETLTSLQFVKLSNILFEMGIKWFWFKEIRYKK